MEKIRIKHFPSSAIQLDSAEYFCISPDLKILSYIMYDTLTFLPLNEESSLPSCLGKFKRYQWQEDYCSDGKYHVLAITFNNFLFIYEVSIQKHDNLFTCIFTILHEWKFSSMMGVPDVCQGESSKIEILSYSQQRIVLLFGERIVMSIVSLPNQLPFCQSAFQIPECDSPSLYVQVHEDMFFTLNEDGTTISSYSLEKGEKQLEWHLQSIFNLHSIGWSAITKFCIASDLETAVICNCRHNVFRLHLNKNLRIEQKPQQKLITAFVKKIPSLTKVSERSQTVANRSQLTLLHQFELPCNLEDVYIENISLMGNNVLLHFQSKEKTGSVLLSFTDSGTINIQERFPERISVIKTNGSFPLLFISGNNIYTYLFSACPERLVSELMICFSGEAAEKLSGLNNWQDIEVKLEVLQHGLKNRQLDVISFFLRTQEDVFHCIWFNQCEGSSKWSTSIELQAQHWKSIISMLLGTVKESIYDTSSCQFAEHLLQLTLSTLTNLVNVMNKGQKKCVESFDEHAMKLSIQFAKYFQEVRSLLHGQDTQVETALDENKCIQDEDLYGYSVSQEIWDTWSQMHWQEVIRHAVKHNKLLSVQTYLLSRHKNDEWIRNENLWHIIVNIGIKMAEETLASGNFKEATEIFANMGLSPDEKVMDVFKSTTNSQLRDNLLEELKREGLLSEEGQKIMNFIKEIEKVYPCRSIEEVKLRDGTSSSDSSSNSNLYSSIVYNWVSKWNENACFRTILFASSGFKNFRVASLPPQICWEYLIEYGKMQEIQTWAGALSSKKAVDKTEFSFPFDWTIRDSMLNCIKPLSALHIKEMVLDLLARFGVFCEEESEDFPLLLRRLGRIHFRLSDMSLFDSKNSTISVSDFIHRVIHYSLQNDLSNFLYYFLKERSYSIQPFPHCIYCSTPLLSVISAFASWSKKSNDSDLAFQSMMAVAQYVYNMPEASIQSLWKHAPVKIIMAMILFAPIQLCRLSHSNCIKVMGVDSAFVQSSLSSIPLLCDTLFKRDKDNNETKLDVTVYHLLQENALFDPAQLFGWQTTNNIINEDASPELPHFSLSSLVDVFGYKRKLTFHYYLSNGRPNFAYVKFIIQELSSSGTLSCRRIAAACKEALIIAIRHYHDVKVTASCIAFTEMLGQDSLSIRTHIHVAKLISGGDNRFQEMADAELVGKMEASFYNKVAAKEILALLELAVNKEISKISDKNPGLEIMWSIPVINFCHIHQLDPPMSYMEQCAKNGDWLKFLAFAQVFQIQLSQVLKLLGTFSNAHLVDHLSNALQWRHPSFSSAHMETSSLSGPKMKTKRKTSEFRKALFERIGVAKQENPATTASAPELSSDEDGSSSIGSDETITNGDFVTMHEDLWGQILSCHNTVCPWRSLLYASCSHHNPVLAVIASSYQGASIQHCLATWLHTSVSTVSSKEDMVLKDITDIEETMKEAMNSRKILLLQKGFKLFLPSSPLLCLINFLVAFLIQKQYESSVDYLKQFQRHLWNYSANSDDEMYTISDVGWLQKMCIILLTASISSCETLYEKKILLRHYFFAKIQSSFTPIEKIPDFNKLYHLIQSIGDLDVKVYVEDLLQPEHTDKYKNACAAIIQKLQQGQHNDEAYVFAKVAKLPLDEILLCQIKNEMQKYRSHTDWNDMKMRIQFWEQCTNTLHIGNVKPDLAAQFFKEESDKSTSYIEKFILTKLAVKWMLEAKSTSKETRKAIGEMEVNMWLYCIKAEVEINKMEATERFSLDIEKCCDDSLDFLAQEIQNPSFVPLKLNNEEELNALNRVIGKLLNLGSIKEAQKINQIFSHQSIDVDIIVTCIKLAKQVITPNDIDPELRKLIPEEASLQTIRKGESFIPFRISEGKNVNMDKVKDSKEEVQKTCLNAKQEEIAHLIKQLGEKATAAPLACKRILIYYLSSQILELTYDEVRMQEQSCKLLKAILTCSYPDKYIIAKELLAVNSTTDDQLTDFLSQETLTCLQVYCDTADFSMAQSNTELIFNPSNVGDTFQHLLFLCEDPSLLGIKLLTIVDREVETKLENWMKPNLCLIVELYIRSHDCFTAACNMEGISRILHQARKMARRLTDAEEYHLLVRMLTGIGRYSEMTYIFDILREKHQFELLFCKGMEKVPHLRIALLDYLKHCCSIDSYVYPMLALNFSMFREIAEMLETSAKESLKKIRKKNSAISNVKDELLTAMQEFADAAESYSKADCISHADNCVKQAKLVALQIYLLPKNIWVIELDNKGVKKIIAEHPKFSESYIIAEAYQNHSSWDHALHRHVIQKGDWNYFAEFHTTIGLNSVIMEDVSRRLILYSPKCEKEIHNLKKLLQKCDAEIKYKIASDFGFTDVISDLLKGDCGAYMKDMMYKFHRRKQSTNLVL